MGAIQYKRRWDFIFQKKKMNKKNYIAIIFILLCNILFAQSKKNDEAPNPSLINYSKYINKPVNYFFQTFRIPIKDTIPYRDYMGIIGSILDFGQKKYLVIYTKRMQKAEIKKTLDENFDSSFFNANLIISIEIKTKGKLKKRYGRRSFGANIVDSSFFLHYFLKKSSVGNNPLPRFLAQK